MVRIDKCEGPRWLLPPSPPVSVLLNNLVSSRSAPARLVIRIAEVKFSLMTTLLFSSCFFNGVKKKFCYLLSLWNQEGILIYPPPAVVSDVDDLGSLNFLRGI